MSAFWLQKAGNTSSEYEDAFAPSSPPDGALQEFRCAIADGATETSFSGLWARILVDAFVSQQLRAVDGGTLLRLAAQWRQEIDRQTGHKPLPWYAEAKLQQGAFSSLSGLTVRADGRWRAVAVGDSCLFQIRPRKAIYAFPYHTPEQFNNHPALLSTSAEGNSTIRVRVARGRWTEGDYFLLMTDALAHFFLSQRCRRARLVECLDQTAFEALVTEGREERQCRNDDVTFLKIIPGFGDDQGVVG